MNFKQRGRIIRKEVQQKKIPLLGSLRVGAKVQQGSREFPTSLDHFIATGKYAGLFHKTFGDEPKTVKIAFISDNMEDSCHEAYEVRDTGGRLLAEGDGEFWRVYDGKTKEYIMVQNSIEDIEKRYGKAREVLIMRFVIPEIYGVFGWWKLSTHGIKTSIPALRDVFDMVMEKANTVVNIPFDLTIEKVKSNKPDDVRTYPVLTLIPNIRPESLEVLGEFIESGKAFRGLVTEEKIEQLQLGFNNESRMLQEKNEVKIVTIDKPDIPVVVDTATGVVLEDEEDVNEYLAMEAAKIDVAFQTKEETEAETEEAVDNGDFYELIGASEEEESLVEIVRREPETETPAPVFQPVPESRLISKEEALQLWKLAQNTGFTEEDAKKLLTSREYDSFNKIKKEDLITFEILFKSKKVLKDTKAKKHYRSML